MMKRGLSQPRLSPGSWLAFAFLFAVGWTLIAGTPAQADEQPQPSSASCIKCHMGIEMPHSGLANDAMENNCVSCHGGNGEASAKEASHILPRNKELWGKSQHPAESYAEWNLESPEYIQFRNPGDLRIADRACGKCHGSYVRNVRKSIMAHDAMVPESGMYANGVSNLKIARLGEAYAPWTDKNGKTIFVAAKIISNPPPTKEAMEKEGELAQLIPWPRFDITFATDSFRAFEKGNNAAGTRALGTDFKTSGVVNVAEKTRLNDPCLWFFGTNNTGGDYRSSGCTACHVVYANSRDVNDSGRLWAQYGNQGFSFSGDKSIPKNEPGHPIMHKLTRSIPASQCMTCHHHNGNGAIATYLGYIWWDQDTDLEYMMKNNYGYDWFLHDVFGDSRYSQVGYHYGNPNTRNIWEHNDDLKNSQMSDLHGHQWYYNAVFKRDRYGRLQDANDNLVADTDPDKWKKAVHLKDIHLEKGMQCIDCHTTVDNHGQGKLYGEYRQYVEIRCQTCHGNATKRADFITGKGSDLSGTYTPFKGGPRNRPISQFWSDGDKRFQASMMDPNMKWEIPQVVDYISKGNPKYNDVAARAMSLTKSGSYGAVVPQDQLAHKDDDMECFTCHTSWSTQCFGCHLYQATNQKAPLLHMDGTRTKLHADYYPQVIRSDAFTLGINGLYSGRKFNPMSPRNPVVVTVMDGNNNAATHQQSSVGSEGWASYNMAPNVPHTVRERETQDCTTCHLSKNKDNNSWLAQVFGEGTNGYSYIGDYSWIGQPGMMKAVRVSYGYEPQPVIGSNLQRVMDPQKFNEFVKSGRRLDKVRYATPGAAGKAYGSAQLVGATHPNFLMSRGEWVFAADGPGGFKVYDVATIDAKRTAQKTLLQPFAWGNQVVVHSKNATGFDMPGTGPMDLTRPQLSLNNEATRWSGYRYAFVTDSEEGLIVVDINTFFDRNIQNNFIKREVTFNPGNALNGALQIRCAGNYAYIACGRNGLKVVDISDPLHPKMAGSVGAPFLTDTRSIQIQFRYGFIADGTGGMKVVDLSDPGNPKAVDSGVARIPEARGLYLSKSWAYVAAGKNGMAIVDIEHPEKLGEPKFFSANGQMNDTNMVTVASTYASTFAYVADGVNGMRVLRLTEADLTPGHLGWSPEAVPMLIATYQSNGNVMCVGEGHRRDRSVDEAGHQSAMSSRVGSHMMNWDDMKKLLYDSRGNLITVSDSRPKRSRSDYGNLPVPPAAWTPDPSPFTKSDEKVQSMR